MSKLFLLSALLALPLLAGCGSIAKEYVSADRATYNAIEPEYRKYVEADESLDDDAKALRYATLDSWKYRLDQAEEANAD